MKSLFLAVLLAGTATSAFAADLPTRKSPVAPAPLYTQPAFTWTGFYIGVNGGFGYDRMGNGGFNNGNFGNSSLGGLVGGTVGYNYQFSQFVIGGEADLDGAYIRSSSSYGFGSNNYRINAITTERLRLGYAVDRALFYVTGGYAGVSTRANFTDNFNGISGSQNNFQSTGTIGGGIEYAFTNNITLKAEYLFVPLGNKTYFGNTPDQVSGTQSLSIARAGLNFKF